MKTFTIARDCRRRRGDRGRPPGQARARNCIAKKHDVTFAFQDFDWGAEHYLPLGPHDARRRHRPAAALRRHPAGRRGPSRNPRPHHPQRPAAAHPPRLRPVRQRAAGVSLSRACARRWPAARAATSISWWCARIPRANTRRWAASSTSTSRKRSPSRPPSSPAAASSASCASPSNWPSSATRRGASPPSPSPTRRATAWCCGTAPFRRWRRSSRISKPNRCWWTPRP